MIESRDQPYLEQDRYFIQGGGVLWTDDGIKADPQRITSLNIMPTSHSKAANTFIGRASERVSTAFESAFGLYRPTDERTQATLDTMHGWLEADKVNMEDLLYGIIGDSVYRETFPPTSYSVEGSARIYAHYRNDIGQNTLDSVMYTLNPDHNTHVTGDPSQSRLALWSEVSKARHSQKTLLQTAGASMMFGMSNAGNNCTPQSTFDKLAIATDAKANRKIAKDLSRLIDLTLKEQESWQDKEIAQDEKGLDGSGV